MPRGPHPDGKSYYRNSSRDQHAAYVEALWRYHRSPLATEAERAFVVATLEGKLCFGLCTVALHGALLSDDADLQAEVRPLVRRMVDEFSQYQRSYDRGENFNRTVILGLLALE